MYMFCNLMTYSTSCHHFCLTLDPWNVIYVRMCALNSGPNAIFLWNYSWSVYEESCITKLTFVLYYQTYLCSSRENQIAGSRYSSI
jgi:hypothetical protein